MKALRSTVLLTLVLLAAAVSVGYSVHATTRVRDLEQRLQRAEARLQREEALLQLRVRLLSDNATPSRADILELPASQAPLASTGAAGLERRIQNIEQQITPHLETLPHDSYK